MKKLEKIIDYSIYGNKREYYVDSKSLRQGSFKMWRLNGELLIESNYLNGKDHGIYKVWGNNALMDYMQQFKKDDHHGVIIEFKYLQPPEKIIEKKHNQNFLLSFIVIYLQKVLPKWQNLNFKTKK